MRRSPKSPAYDAPVPHGAAALGVTQDMGYRQRVYTVVRAIPSGQVLGYGHVAAILGSPRAARQVGYALAALGPDTTVPWWRVLRSDGSIALQGDPLRGPVQGDRLAAEGVVIQGFRVSMADHRWPGPALR